MSEKFTNVLPGVPNVESPFAEEIFSDLGVSDEILELARSLNRYGYASFDFPEPDLDSLSAQIVEALDPHYDWDGWRSGGLHSLRLTDAWKSIPQVRRIAANARMREILAQLYGREPIPFQTLNFPIGTQQSAHSDVVHFHSMPERFMCGVWVAFEDMNDNNGPLEYYPGSHRLPVYYNHDLGIPAATMSDPYVNYHRFEEMWLKLAEVHGLKRERFVAKKGQALIWAANLLHGGMAVTDPEATRHSQVTHYYFEGCSYFTPLLSNPFNGEIAYRDVVDVVSGQRVANRVNGELVSTDFIERCRPPGFS